MKRRTANDIASKIYDVIVVGGGINGAAIARDAALRGLSVLLLEKGDFASGTTSWSTRLIHGGLRYLEHHEFGLVRESLTERDRLLRNAPHLVKPLPILVPVYKNGSRRPTTIRAGLTLYDAFSLGKNLPRHRWFSKKEAAARWPALKQKGLHGVFQFYDAQIAFPERLVVENLQSACEHGAAALNYARVDKIVNSGAVATGVEFTDLMTGSRHRVRSRTIANAAGPWVDGLLREPGDHERPLIGGTKGSHIFLPRVAGAPDEALYSEAGADGRPFFVIPWNGVTMVGTTDIPFSGDLDDLTAGDDEVAYLLNEINAIFPNWNFSERDVLFSYAGVRPLPASDAGSTGSITRRHSVVNHAPNHVGLFSIIGGKLTTHRSLAESVVDVLGDAVGIDSPCLTRDLSLPYARGIDPAGVADLMKGLDVPTAARLVSVYGAAALEIKLIADLEPALAAPIVPGTPTLAAEVLYVTENEQAIHLADIVIRRMMAAYNADLGQLIAHSAANIAVQYLGWSAARTSDELDCFSNEIIRLQAGAGTDQ